MTLQATLAEGGLRLAGVAEKAGDFPEAARWRQLGELERKHDESLAAQGLQGLAEAQIAAAKEPAAMAEAKIVVLAVPDPLPLAVTAWEAHARRVPVEIVVFADSSATGEFEACGRPERAAWRQRELPLADFTGRVSLESDPAGQADRLATLVRAYGSTPERVEAPAAAARLGLGVADPEVLPLLESALAAAGIPTFNPEGRPRLGTTACTICSPRSRRWRRRPRLRRSPRSPAARFPRFPGRAQRRRILGRALARRTRRVALPAPARGPGGGARAGAQAGPVSGAGTRLGRDRGRPGPVLGGSFAEGAAGTLGLISPPGA